MSSFNGNGKQAETPELDWHDFARQLDGLEDADDPVPNSQYQSAVKSLAAASVGGSVAVATDVAAKEEPSPQIPLYRSRWGKLRVWMHRRRAIFVEKTFLLSVNPSLAAACWWLTPPGAWVNNMAAGSVFSPWWYLTLMAFGALVLCSLYIAGYVLWGDYARECLPKHLARFKEEDAVIIAALWIWNARFRRCEGQKAAAAGDLQTQGALTAMQADLLRGMKYNLLLLQRTDRPSAIVLTVNNNAALLRKPPVPPNANPLFTAR